jgi:hypothetical protein
MSTGIKTHIYLTNKARIPRPPKYILIESRH